MGLFLGKFLRGVFAVICVLGLFFDPIFAQNQAQVFCENLGFDYLLVDIGWGEQGLCVFSDQDGDFCDAWAFYDGACGEDYYDSEVKEEVEEEFEDWGEMEESDDDEIEPEESELASSSSFPSSFDWRDYGIMSSVKNQDQCGSCWAHATLAAMEAKYRILNPGSASGITFDLSEQDLVSCSGAGTCNGGLTSSAMAYIQTYGVTTEDCFPYQEPSSSGGTPTVSCSSKPEECSEELWTISGYGKVSSDVETVKQYLLPESLGGLGKGPLVISLGTGNLIYPENPYADIFTCEYSKSSGHAVLLVGYEDTGNSTTSYWILKNSWDLTWPNGRGNGYFKVSMDCFELTRVWYIDDVYSMTDQDSDDEYCSAKSASSAADYITSVALNGQAKTTSVHSPYSKYTDDIFALLEQGETYDVEVTSFASSSTTHYVSVWIDFDQDGTFADSEQFDLGQTACSGECVLSGEIEVPANATTGNTRMRIRLSDAPPQKPCGIYGDGEVEDYEIQVIEATSPCGPIDGDVTLTEDVRSEGTCFELQADNVVIDCGGNTIYYAESEEGYGIVNNGYSGVEIRNCNIVQSGEVGDSPAIFLDNAENNVIEGNIMQTKGLMSTGISLKSSSGVIISSNQIYTEGDTNTHGITLESSDGNLLQENEVNSEGLISCYGIYLYQAVGNELSQNQVEMIDATTLSSMDAVQMNVGIQLTQCDDNSIESNYVHVSGFGLHGIYDVQSGTNRFSENNLFMEGVGYGIRINECEDTLVQENKIISKGESATGIKLEYLARGGTVASNSISCDGEGVDGIESYSKGTEITNNNVTLSGTDGSAIVLAHSLNLVEGNSILILGSSQTGVNSWSDSDSEGTYSKIISNEITLAGPEGHGILPLSFSEVTSNTITINGVYCTGIGFGNTVGETLSEDEAPTPTHLVLVEGNILRLNGDYDLAISAYNDKVLVVENNLSLEGNSSIGVKVSLGAYELETGTWGSKLESLITQNQISGSAHDLGGIFVGLPRSSSSSGANFMPTGMDVGGWTSQEVDASYAYAEVLQNDIAVSGEYVAGVIYSAISSDTLDGNNIVVDGISSVGIYMEGASNLTITNNAISALGRKGLGFDSHESSELILYGNAFETPQGPTLYISPSTNKTHYNHTIDDTNTEQGEPIYYYFDQPDLKISDDDEIGQLYLAFCNNSKIKNLELDKDGITLANMNGTILRNVSIEADACGTAPFALIYANDTHITDSKLESSCENTAEIGLYNATEVNATNTTYEDIYISTEESYLERYWYLDLNVTDSEGSPIEGAKVVCTNPLGEEQFIETTDEEGKIERKILLKYTQEGATGFNPGGKSHYTPYSLLVLKGALVDTKEVALESNENLTIKLGE